MQADGTGSREIATHLPLIGLSAFEPPTLMWSPDGARLLLTNTESVFVLELDSGDIREISEGSHASWSPDGSQIAVVNVYSSEYLKLIGENGEGQVLVTKSSLANHKDN